MNHFKLKMESGFYWATGTRNRRYGRFTATEDQAFVLCGEHANSLLSVFKEIDSTAKIIAVDGNSCDDCDKRVGRK